MPASLTQLWHALPRSGEVYELEDLSHISGSSGASTIGIGIFVVALAAIGAYFAFGDAAA